MGNDEKFDGQFVILSIDGSYIGKTSRISMTDILSIDLSEDGESHMICALNNEDESVKLLKNTLKNATVTPELLDDCEVANEYSPYENDIETLKKRIKYCKNPLELKQLNRKLNAAYKKGM